MEKHSFGRRLGSQLSSLASSRLRQSPRGRSASLALLLVSMAEIRIDVRVGSESSSEVAGSFSLASFIP